MKLCLVWSFFVSISVMANVMWWHSDPRSGHGRRIEDPSHLPETLANIDLITENFQHEEDTLLIQVLFTTAVNLRLDDRIIYLLDRSLQGELPADDEDPCSLLTQEWSEIRSDFLSAMTPSSALSGPVRIYKIEIQCSWLESVVTCHFHSMLQVQDQRNVANS